MISFWDENKLHFTGAAGTFGDKAIRSIDSDEALGLHEGGADGSKWIVYGMTKKVHSNSRAINGVLSTLRARLQLLSEQDVECPFCLEVLEKVRNSLHMYFFY